MNESRRQHSPLAGTKAMILAAGLGMRFKPWTDRHPKALALVNGKTLLQRNVEWLQRYGITEIIVNIHHFPGQIRDAIESNKGWGSHITISDETAALLETGGGLKKAAWFFAEKPFVLLNVDILTDLQLDAMMKQHLREKPIATLATTNRASSRYFWFDQENRLCGWKNMKTGEERGPVIQFTAEQRNGLLQKAFSGIHIIEPKLLSIIGREGKFSMVDVYLDLAKTERILSFDHTGSKFIDVGRPESVAIAESLFP
jgi:N-acetyl-alpha-D-muramate 1-phosphate uridylyltransferase